HRRACCRAHRRAHCRAHSRACRAYRIHRWHADLRRDPDGQDYHPGRGAVGHNRRREAEDSGRGGHPL
ncbi:unnamed protein product, partial [Ectocarpus fasciculatus]